MRSRDTAVKYFHHCNQLLTLRRGRTDDAVNTWANDYHMSLERPLLVLTREISVTGEFPAQWPVTRSFDLRLNKWLSKQSEAGDSRRHRARYDVTVMLMKTGHGKAFCISGHFMMTSSNGNIFRVTGHLCGEFTGLRWIPRTKASDAELWCFFYLPPNKGLSKQWRGWWFETPSCPLWRHRNVSRISFTKGHHLFV